MGFDTLKKNHHCVSIRRTVQIKRGLVDFICIFNPDKLNDYLKEVEEANSWDLTASIARSGRGKTVLFPLIVLLFWTKTSV